MLQSTNIKHLTNDIMIWTFWGKLIKRIVLAIITISLLIIAVAVVISWIKYENWSHETWLNDIYGYYEDNDEGYIYNFETGEKVLTNINFFYGPRKDGSGVEIFTWKSTPLPQQRYKRGYINTKTAEIIAEPQFDKAWIFRSGVAGVCKNDSVYFIDIKGDCISKQKFPYTIGWDYVYEGDYCVIKINEKYGIINKQGVWVAEPIWDGASIDLFSSSFHLSRNGNIIEYCFGDESIIRVPTLEYKGDTIFAHSDTTVVYVKQGIQ